MRCSCLAGVVETRTGRDPRWNKPSPADAPSSPLPPPLFCFVAAAVQRGRPDPTLTRSAETETQTDGGVGALSGSAIPGALANAVRAVTSWASANFEARRRTVNAAHGTQPGKGERRLGPAQYKLPRAPARLEPLIASAWIDIVRRLCNNPARGNHNPS
ncbi:uncharacterized protein TrAFT101_010049 [Trichoderma asperellum]|uniref:uncharacterized protein n=1 Tax=Trichoderma asperellum TaxID=101201 RepID=UPI00331C1E28|nr:hypothetical protein TrAFT101_010049 [Trichoderma asperellum]